jgi:hypothetical protein
LNSGAHQPPAVIDIGLHPFAYAHGFPLAFLVNCSEFIRFANAVERIQPRKNLGENKREIWPELNSNRDAAQAKERAL